jgi:ribosomal protein L30E
LGAAAGPYDVTPVLRFPVETSIFCIGKKKYIKNLKPSSTSIIIINTQTQEAGRTVRLVEQFSLQEEVYIY